MKKWELAKIKNDIFNKKSELQKTDQKNKGFSSKVSIKFKHKIPFYRR